MGKPHAAACCMQRERRARILVVWLLQRPPASAAGWDDGAPRSQNDDPPSAPLRLLLLPNRTCPRPSVYLPVHLSAASMSLMRTCRHGSTAHGFHGHGQHAGPPRSSAEQPSTLGAQRGVLTMHAPIVGRPRVRACREGRQAKQRPQWRRQLAPSGGGRGPWRSMHVRRTHRLPRDVQFQRQDADILWPAARAGPSSAIHRMIGLYMQFIRQRTLLKACICAQAA